MEALLALVLPFFSGFTAGELMNMLVLFILFANKNIGVNAINFFKNKFGLDSQKAQFFFLACLTVISLASMFVTGQITEVQFTLKTMLATVAAALVPAKLAYKRLMNK